MNNSTPEEKDSKGTKKSKIVRMKKTEMHASSDSIFFIRMFARACNAPTTAKLSC